MEHVCKAVKPGSSRRGKLIKELPLISVLPPHHRRLSCRLLSRNHYSLGSSSSFFDSIDPKATSPTRFFRDAQHSNNPWWYKLVLVAVAHPYAAIDASAETSMTMLQNFGIDESGGSTSVQWSGPLNE